MMNQKLGKPGSCFETDPDISGYSITCETAMTSLVVRDRSDDSQLKSTWTGSRGSGGISQAALEEMDGLRKTSMVNGIVFESISTFSHDNRSSDKATSIFPWIAGSSLYHTPFCRLQSLTGRRAWVNINACSHVHCKNRYPVFCPSAGQWPCPRGIEHADV